ncbi:MAG: 1,4-dihydroxy-2-naphthoate octaprenyltransferase [Deltaproteobacteria bacterium]|nr:1,4-dihydroxy-2-naphthoate octaprenyltransferase [Deltaproteobacteria bacterium]
MMTVAQESVGAAPRPAPIVVWWRALRAYSFPASLVPCLVGAAYVAFAGAPVDWRFLPLVLVGGVALHVGTNLVNDAVDFQRGVDTPDALGGSGVLTAGWLGARDVWIGALVAFGVAALVGVPLIVARGWPFALIGLVGALGGYAYTGPPLALKYRALGEVWVFVLMGTLMVVGAGYALSGTLPPRLWLCSIPVGFLVAAILAANNQRDREGDHAHRVRTLATLLGPAGARVVTIGLVAGTYVSLVALWVARCVPALALLALLTVPLAVPLLRALRRDGPGRPLAPGTVERIAALHLFFGLAYALGLTLHAVFAR